MKSLKGKMAENKAIMIEEKVYTLPEPGIHQARISDVRDLGIVQTKHGEKDKIQIVFDMLDQQDEENKPVTASIFAAKTLGKKATLRKVLDQLGVPVGGSFNARDLVGIKCQVVVSHNPSADGTRTYANIDTIVPQRRKVATTDEI